MMQSSSAVTSGFAAVISALLWVCVVAVGVIEHSAGNWTKDIRKVLFRNYSQVLMEKWAIDITLPQWSLCLWEFIYTWNTLWVFYCVVIICRPVSRHTKEGVTTCSVNAFPTSFHALWGFIGISHLCWILFWDREVIVASIFFQGFVVLASMGCLYISHISVSRNGVLLDANHPWDLWVCRTLVQNGIAMLATWSLILFVINLASALTHEGSLPSYVTSLGALVAISAFLVLWFLLETFALDPWVRYTFSVYPTVVWATAAILVRHFYPWSHVTILCLSILGTALLMLIIRVPLVVWRSFSFPLYYEQTIPHGVAPISKGSPNRQMPIPTV